MHLKYKRAVTEMDFLAEPWSTISVAARISHRNPFCYPSSDCNTGVYCLSTSATSNISTAHGVGFIQQVLPARRLFRAEQHNMDLKAPWCIVVGFTKRKKKRQRQELLVQCRRGRGLWSVGKLCWCTCRDPKLAKAWKIVWLSGPQYWLQWL